MDPGVDDALALMLALNSPELDVLGVCTVNGNVPVDKGTRNTLALLSMLGRPEVPVYRGAERPLRRDPVHATEIHGPGGLGDTALPPADFDVSGSAANFLTEVLEDRPNEVTIVAVGPLTNLATVEEQSPGLLRKARALVVMGGAVSEPGNVSPTAEFNFFADPDAARAVVASGAALTLVPLDATHRVQITKDELAMWSGGSRGATANFVAASMAPAMAHSRRVYGAARFCLHDPMAVGFVVDPSNFRVSRVFADVEVGNGVTSGQMVVDLRPFVDDAQRKGVQVSWVSDVQVEAFKSMFKDRVF